MARLADSQPQGNVTCPLSCLNNSTCTFGSADFSNHPRPVLDFHVEFRRDGGHCACLPGWTALLCNVPYKRCNSDQHICYYGGQCIPHLLDLYANDQLYCDCQQATYTRESPTGIPLVGKYCENLDLLFQGGGNGRQDCFCVNGGVCDNTTTIPASCLCPPGYEGPHCEYRTGSVPVCTMSCSNGGLCRLGLENLAYTDLGYQGFWSSNHTIGMYCECPPGYFGTR